MDPYLKTRVIFCTSLSRGDFRPLQLPSEDALPFRCCCSSSSLSVTTGFWWSSRPEMIISGGGSDPPVGDNNCCWSLSTLMLCPNWDLLVRPRLVDDDDGEPGTASQQEDGGDVVALTRWGWEEERGMVVAGGHLFTFDMSGDFMTSPWCDDEPEDDVVSMLEERRSSRWISVVERQVPRFGDFVLKRRWKKLPPLAPWWPWPARRGLLAARNDRWEKYVYCLLAQLGVNFVNVLLAAYGPVGLRRSYSRTA